jgi:radical SAM superfamily enzyme YgiQ (UPF0313 family)
LKELAQNYGGRAKESTGEMACGDLRNMLIFIGFTRRGCWWKGLCRLCVPQMHIQPSG